MSNFLDQKHAGIAIFLASVIIPGSGFVLLGKPLRGLMYVVWILFFGILTYKYSSPNISLIGRFAGGIAVWALSLVELQRLLKIRSGKNP